MRRMVEVTLVQGGEESMEDQSSQVASFRSGETCMATRFLLHGRTCYTSMELIAARFAYLRLVVRR